MKTNQLEAGYRVAMQRIIRGAVGIVYKDAPTVELEAKIKELVKVAPAVVARGITQTFEDAARSWERGNNSGNSATMAAEDENCDRLRDRGERILKLWGVKTSYPGLYPGLYPVFTVPGKFNECEWHDVASLLRVLGGIR